MSPSIWQILIVVAIIVVLFGAKRIPDLGKSLGQAIRGFKKGISEDEIDVTPSDKIESQGQAQTQEQKEKETQNS